MTRNPLRKLVIVLLLLAICGWLIGYKGLRYGKDLQGGVSLVYAVNFPDNTTTAQRMETLNQTIAILKQRVNPTGLLDISMQPIGSDRIEIVMPLMDDQAKDRKKEYQAALAELIVLAEIPQDKFDESVRRGAAVADWGQPAGSVRAQRVQDVQATFTDIQQAREALRQSVAASAPEDVLGQREQALARLEIRYEQQRDAVLRMSLDQRRIERTVALSTKRELLKDAQNKPVIDPATGDKQLAPSQRETAVSALKSEYPHLASGLDRVIAAFDAYNSRRKGLDDPEDLVRLLQGAGVLDFHIAVNPARPEGVSIEDLKRDLKEKGPDLVDSSIARWFLINDLKQWYEKPEQLQILQKDPEAYFSQYGGGLVVAQYDAQLYMLLYASPTKSMTHSTDSSWSVTSAYITQDQLGLPAVAFRLDNAGGQMMGRMTGAHVGQPMAIVLDGQVYSAPNLNSRIDNSGVIEGRFSQAEIDYLVRVLASGALEARLSPQPISTYTIGPSLGADNLSRGMIAFILSVLVTVVIMLGYYFLAGLIANIALMANAIIIFGVMALLDGTFTLPGLAGMALSIAMAVDANVLIYERIREEMVNNHEDLRTAIRLGYQRAMSAIIDGNITHLITCIVLMYTATTEVKGFALTMILGVIATLFTALFVTRLLFTFYVDKLHARSLPMLPTVFPGIHKALEPHVNWIAKRYLFLAISLVAVALSIALVFSRGAGMLDTEFRGGVSMTMETRILEPASGNTPARRLSLKRSDVENRVHAIGERATDSQPLIRQLRTASVLTVGETQDFSASTFQIKVSSPPGVDTGAQEVDAVVTAVVKEFGDQLDVRQPLTFAGAGADQTSYTFPITSPDLGRNINRPQFQQGVSEFLGGVAILLDDISPPISEAEVADRLARMRDQPDFRDTTGRNTRVIGLTPASQSGSENLFSSVAVLVTDPAANYSKVEFATWDRSLASREWQLASQALQRPPSLQQVSEFSSAMAESLRASATVAVILSILGMLIYIWVRFGSFRYSLATITAVTHNVIICLGALALTHLIAGTRFAQMLGLDEFRIDLNVIAALLTIIGYSLNDTIVIMDRIRENRGKRLLATPEIVNNSINQTFSRTILTGGSTIIASIILYVMGGTGIQPFAYTFLIGLVVGTYSSVTIAAPLVIGGSPKTAPVEPSPIQLQIPTPSASA